MNQIRVPVEDFAVCGDEVARASARGSDTADPVFGNLVEELVVCRWLCSGLCSLWR